MRASRRQLPVPAALLPGSCSRPTQSTVGAGSTRCPVAMSGAVPCPCWFSSDCVVMVPPCQAQHCPLALPLCGRGAAAGIQPWGQNRGPKAGRCGWVLLVVQPQPGR